MMQEGCVPGVNAKSTPFFPEDSLDLFDMGVYLSEVIMEVIMIKEDDKCLMHDCKESSDT